MVTAYMSTAGSADTPPAAECRRNPLRRTQSAAAAVSCEISSSNTREGRDRNTLPPRPPAPALSWCGGGEGEPSRSAPPDWPVLFGSLSSTGRSREMEDAVSIRPSFFRPEFGPPFHFFAVFDGHGGSQVSTLCKNQMHLILAEELARTPPPPPDPMSDNFLRSAVTRCFARMDDLALTVCACGNVGQPLCSCVRSGFESEIIGSTAVVALVGGGRILVANCGDSRAVLSRGGRALAVSSDHKPDRPDELARITAAGGRVIYHNGARVHGILAMSRALGDRYLKPEVISEPEFCTVERTDEDECLIIASDGLWDVMPNDLACDVARRCLEEADRNVEYIGELADNPGDQREEQASDTKCTLAATLLARLALGRQSGDNISVIVIDLRRK